MAVIRMFLAITLIVSGMYISQVQGEDQDAGFKLERIETFLKLDNIYIFQVKNN